MVELVPELLSLMTRVNCPAEIRTFLLSLSPPVTEVSQVALIGEKEPMIAKVLGDARVTEFTLELNARALALGVSDSASLSFSLAFC